jgi:hypothetical protein
MTRMGRKLAGTAMALAAALLLAACRSGLTVVDNVDEVESALDLTGDAITATEPPPAEPQATDEPPVAGTPEQPDSAAPPQGERRGNGPPPGVNPPGLSRHGTPPGLARRGVDECGGHPQVARLADRYGADEDDIAALVCAGYGVGAIKRAYDLAAQHDVPVETIFEMDRGGMTWGDIRREIAGADEDDE